MNEYSMHGLARMVTLCAAMLESPPSIGRDLALAHLQTLTNKMFGDSSYTKVFYSAVSLLALNKHDVNVLSMQSETRDFATELIAESNAEVDKVLESFESSTSFSEYLSTTRALVGNSAELDALRQTLADVDPATVDLPDIASFDRIPDA